MRDSLTLRRTLARACVAPLVVAHAPISVRLPPDRTPRAPTPPRQPSIRRAWRSPGPPRRQS
jgi:hypothetical protein